MLLQRRHNLLDYVLTNQVLILAISTIDTTQRQLPFGSIFLSGGLLLFFDDNTNLSLDCPQ
jgi:hypothetical protein